MAIERLLTSPFSYKVSLDYDLATRPEKKTWCQQNLQAFLSNKPSWIAPVLDNTIWHMEYPTKETWNFRREEDAVMFDMVWNDKIGGNSFT